MLNTKSIKALTFDTGGTILVGILAFQKDLKNKNNYKFNYSTAKFANLMRRKSLT